MPEPDAIDQFGLVHLGTEASLWWKSPLGRYVIKRSLDETEEIRAAFRDVDAGDRRKVEDLQLRWKVAEQALIWLNEAIKSGENAMTMLEIDHER